MTTYIILNTLVLFVMLASLAYLIYYVQIKKHLPENNKPEANADLDNLTSPDWKVKSLLLLSVIIILFAFISPFLFTRSSPNSDFDFSKFGQIGDTIGGLMNPFITLAGVLVTGLAFYIQYKANLLQRELFLKEQKLNKDQLQSQINNQNEQEQIQKFDSRFYEMLRLHRENVSEMKILGYDFLETGNLKRVEKSTEGRAVFISMKMELECIIAMISKDRTLNQDLFNKSYKLFFSGLDEFEKSFPEEQEIIQKFRDARNKHESPNEQHYESNYERKKFIAGHNLNFNYIPFSGHGSRLSHYFRHLYLTVKSVANDEVINDYESRMGFLRILRAQLSNHEQILLFYNWVSGYGSDWENEKHSFFTEYCMIHNLWFDSLYPDKFIKNKVNHLRQKEVKLRKGNMYEID